jgi:hypothetical protein
MGGRRSRRWVDPSVDCRRGQQSPGQAWTNSETREQPINTQPQTTNQSTNAGSCESIAAGWVGSQPVRLGGPETTCNLRRSAVPLQPPSFLRCPLCSSGRKRTRSPGGVNGKKGTRKSVLIVRGKGSSQRKGNEENRTPNRKLEGSGHVGACILPVVSSGVVG